MSSYAVDEENSSLVRTWDTGRGQRAAIVAVLPAAATSEQRLILAVELSRLCEALWHCYTHPPSSARSTKDNTAGWRQQENRAGFGLVDAALRNPELPDEAGSLLDSLDPVEHVAHRVGRALHDIGDRQLQRSTRADIKAEIEAVKLAEGGDLTGRAAQALALSTPYARPSHVAAADAILNENPLDGTRLLDRTEPTAAAVAAARWLQASAEVAARAAGMPVEKVLEEANNIEDLRYMPTAEVLTELLFSRPAQDVVVEMITSAMLLADGIGPDVPAALQETDQPAELIEYTETDMRPVWLTSLDPRRPAPDLLECLLQAIQACRAVYGEYRDGDDLPDDAEADEETAVQQEEARVDTEFCDKIRARAAEIPLQLS